MTIALLCLALNVYHEARGEPFAGQVAVAQVTMRRARFRDERVCEVVVAPKQFSWTGSKKKKPAERAAWGRAVLAARKAMLWAKGAGPDHSAGATHYYAPGKGVPPTWSRGRTPAAVIGGHYFYGGV